MSKYYKTIRSEYIPVVHFECSKVGIFTSYCLQVSGGFRGFQLKNDYATVECLITNWGVHL